ncbi:MAG: dihydrofolate reductase [Candidatus Peregrinibacteria bacterium]|nr:dihydrofolate reductase [Candidatus Peregrinibacteria bacterium]
MILSLIAAADEGNVIGKDNALLWRLPGDFARMKELTKGHTLIMGRKTHESIGRALPNRRNIVISRQEGIEFPGCEVTSSLEDALALARESGDEEVFIFGGGEVYRQALPLAHRIYLTRVHAHFDGDAFFPELPQKEWLEIQSEPHDADDENPYAHTFLVYERVRE